MRLTRQRLKQIIMEEINLVEATPDMADLDLQVVDDQGNAPANQGGMDEITEGLEMVTPENIKLVADVVAQMGMNFAPAIIMTALALPGIEAVKYLKQKATEQSADESPERVQEEENDNALEELITQAIQEELGRL
jgi:hypothetical protein